MTILNNTVHVIKHTENVNLLLEKLKFYYAANGYKFIYFDLTRNKFVVVKDKIIKNKKINKKRIIKIFLYL